MSKAETSVCYTSGNLFLLRRHFAPFLQCDQRHQQDLAGESWSAEGAPNGIGGRGSQADSEESDRGTARWIGDQLHRN